MPYPKPLSILDRPGEPAQGAGLAGRLGLRPPGPGPYPLRALVELRRDPDHGRGAGRAAADGRRRCPSWSRRRRSPGAWTGPCTAWRRWPTDVGGIRRVTYAESADLVPVVARPAGGPADARAAAPRSSTSTPRTARSRCTPERHRGRALRAGLVRPGGRSATTGVDRGPRPPAGRAVRRPPRRQRPARGHRGGPLRTSGRPRARRAGRRLTAARRGCRTTTSVVERPAAGTPMLAACPRRRTSSRWPRRCRSRTPSSTASARDTTSGCCSSRGRWPSRRACAPRRPSVDVDVLVDPMRRAVLAAALDDATAGSTRTPTLAHGPAPPLVDPSAPPGRASSTCTTTSRASSPTRRPSSRRCGRGVHASRSPGATSPPPTRPGTRWSSPCTRCATPTTRAKRRPRRPRSSVLRDRLDDDGPARPGRARPRPRRRRHRRAVPRRGRRPPVGRGSTQRRRPARLAAAHRARATPPRSAGSSELRRLPWYRVAALPLVRRRAVRGGAAAGRSDAPEGAKAVRDARRRRLRRGLAAMPDAIASIRRSGPAPAGDAGRRHRRYPPPAGGRGAGDPHRLPAALLGAAPGAARPGGRRARAGARLPPGRPGEPRRPGHAAVGGDDRQPAPAACCPGARLWCGSRCRGRVVAAPTSWSSSRPTASWSNYRLLAALRRDADRPRVVFWGHGGNLQASGPVAALCGAVQAAMSRRAHWWLAYTEGSADRVAALGLPPRPGHGRPERGRRRRPVRTPPDGSRAGASTSAASTPTSGSASCSRPPAAPPSSATTSGSS